MRSAPRYIGDEDRVRQTLINLLSNAIRFSEPGGQVDVSIAAVDRPDAELAPEAVSELWIRARMRDRGLGIPAEQLERIFEPFVQVDATHTRTRGGTGLGLTISRRLARPMEGDLTVSSKLGNGSTFTLWLPAAPAEGGSSAPPVADVERVAVEVGSARAFEMAGQALLSNLGAVLGK